MHCETGLYLWQWALVIGSSMGVGIFIAYYVNTYATDPATDELADTLQDMVNSEVEYMTRNHLGDPEKQHNVIRARAALAAYGSW